MTGRQWLNMTQQQLCVNSIVMSPACTRDTNLGGMLLPAGRQKSSPVQARRPAMGRSTQAAQVREPE